MKKIYDSPICEIVVMNNADVITSSPNGNAINLFDHGYGNEINLGEYDFEK